MVSKDGRGVTFLFFPLSLSLSRFHFFIFFTFFPLLCCGIGSLWCNSVESSVQDSQWKTALTVIGGSKHPPLHVILVLGRAADLRHVSCCAESTRGSAKDTKRKRDTLWSHTGRKEKKNISSFFSVCVVIVGIFFLSLCLYHAGCTSGEKGWFCINCVLNDWRL